MQNITELTQRLTEVFDALHAGTLAVPVASELNNACGKIIKARAEQLKYYELRKEQPTIPFWREPPESTGNSDRRK